MTRPSKEILVVALGSGAFVFFLVTWVAGSKSALYALAAGSIGSLISAFVVTARFRRMRPEDLEMAELEAGIMERQWEAKRKQIFERSHLIAKMLGASGHYKDQNFFIQAYDSLVAVKALDENEEMVSVFIGRRERIEKRTTHYGDRRTILAPLPEGGYEFATKYDEDSVTLSTELGPLIIDQYLPGTWEENFKDVYNRAYQEWCASQEECARSKAEEQEREDKECLQREIDSLREKGKRFGL